MEGLDHYKSLVSDEEVINALIKESKAREGLLETTRIRPNVHFLQRTVNHLVTSNNKVTEKQEQLKAEEKERNKIYRAKKTPVRKKLPIEYIREILTERIEFVKPADESLCETSCKISQSSRVEFKQSEASCSSQSGRVRRLNGKTKSPFQQIREILTKNNSTKLDQKNNESKNTTKQFDNNNGTDVCLDEVVTLSDSESSDSQESVQFVKCY